MDLGLSGRVAFVSGASRGIGRAAALTFAQEGAAVGVGYHSDARAAQAVVDAIIQGGGRALAIAMDLGDDASLDGAIDAVLEDYGRLDALVNVAGRLPEAGAFVGQLDGQLRRALRLNLEGPARLIQHATPAIRDAGFGRIVSVSTIHAQDGAAQVTAHTAAKSALHGLTRSLARELGADGILVNAVLPGLTLSETMRELAPAAHIEADAARNPTRRNALPGDLARLIVFLCSPANAYINGALIRHDGGV